MRSERLRRRRNCNLEGMIAITRILAFATIHQGLRESRGVSTPDAWNLPCLRLVESQLELGAPACLFSAITQKTSCAR